MQTIQDFITRLGIELSAERVDSNPNMESHTKYPMDHWQCKFHRKDGRRVKTMTTYFSMGVAHRGREPSAADVLDCMASDSASVENTHFERWAEDIGYDSDSRKAERIYQACVKQSENLERFLGKEEYQKLLFETERL